MNIREKKENQGLLGQIEKISSDIQLLALNIAVAAAKMAHERHLGPEINQKLSQLVNESSQAVKQMNLILRAAKTEYIKKDVMIEQAQNEIDENMIENIDLSLKTIISDSEKLTKLLADLRKSR